VQALGCFITTKTAGTSLRKKLIASHNIPLAS
jgi:hypothetical protein